MPNVQFPCPACGQTIACDEQHAGMELTCPVCQTPITAPAPTAAAPATAPAPKKERLSVSAAAHAPQPSAPAPGPVPAPQQGYAPAKKSSIKKGPILKLTVGLILIPVILVLSWPYIKKAQEKVSGSLDKAGEGSGGGQVGHILELNSVLDATEPSKLNTYPANSQYASAIDQAEEAQATSTAATAKPSANLPVIPPTYTLNVEESEIPHSRLNGTLAGADFTPDLVRFERSGQNYVLQLRQGTNGVADRELLIYLRPKPNQSFETNTISISKAIKQGNPQIVKKWKTSARLFGQKQFSAGYALTLVFEKIHDGSLAGKIYVALPDPEKTVLAGHFTAETTIDEFSE